MATLTVYVGLTTTDAAFNATGADGAVLYAQALRGTAALPLVGAHSVAFRVRFAGSVDVRWAALAPPPPPTPPCAGGRALCGTATVLAGTRTVDLTYEGTDDWMHFGATSATSIERKAVAHAALPAGFAVVGAKGDAVRQFGGCAVSYSWQDGAGAAATNGGTATGVFVGGRGNGFRMKINVPPSATGAEVAVLRLYAGAWNSHGTLTATHSSGASFVSTQGPKYNKGGTENVRFELVLRAVTGAASYVIVTWVMAEGDGNITLQAASLRMAAEDGAAASSSDGATFVMTLQAATLSV